MIEIIFFIRAEDGKSGNFAAEEKENKWRRKVITRIPAF
jgi:hypothetical protein